MFANLLVHSLETLNQVWTFCCPAMLDLITGHFELSELEFAGHVLWALRTLCNKGIFISPLFSTLKQHRAWNVFSKMLSSEKNHEQLFPICIKLFMYISCNAYCRGALFAKFFIWQTFWLWYKLYPRFKYRCPCNKCNRSS